MDEQAKRLNRFFAALWEDYSHAIIAIAIIMTILALSYPVGSALARDDLGAGLTFVAGFLIIVFGGGLLALFLVPTVRGLISLGKTLKETWKETK